MPLPYVPPQGLLSGRSPVRVERVVLSTPTTEIDLGPYPWGSVIRVYGNLIVDSDYGMILNSDRAPYYYYIYEGVAVGGLTTISTYSISGVGLWGAYPAAVWSIVPGVWLGTALPAGPSTFMAMLWPCRFIDGYGTHDAYCFNTVSWVEGWLTGVGYEYIVYVNRGFYAPPSHPDEIMVSLIEYPLLAPPPQFQPGSEVVVEVLE